MARSELTDFAGGEKNVSCWEMVVQQTRDLSALIAGETGVRHESPQIILFRNGKAVWNTSHGGITRESLRAAMNSAS